ncbi:MAG: efflux transporter outer membrane subunit [Caulobacteraceae bacterium]|nr:efflux transporter outer membrane subunit [Caulobacteraceae bacterium]
MTLSLPHKAAAGLTLVAPLLAAALLAGCAVGPDYKGPSNAAPLSTAAGQFHRAGVAPVTDAPPPARWWEGLDDPALTRLVDRALAASPTIAQAQARVRAARATLDQQRAKQLPSGGATGLAAFTEIPSGLLGQGGSSLDLYSLGFDASWELDIFGGTRRAVEAQGAQAGVAEAQLADAQVELAAEVAQAYVNLRDVQARLALSTASADIERQMLDLTRQRRAAGTAGEADVEQFSAQLSQTEAQRMDLTGQVERTVDQLSMLTGAEPGALDAELAATAQVPTPPVQTPVGDPAGLLRRRPDIRTAERRLAASNAQIGQNVAQLFPKVSLLGTVGYSAVNGAGLPSGVNLASMAAPYLSWNILSYPRIEGEIREAKANHQAAEAEYRASVLSALQDAEAALSRYGRQRQSLAALADADASATRAAALARQRYEAGTVSLIDALDAERQRLQAEQSLAQAKAALTNDYVALQKSLGLGWDAPASPKLAAADLRQR